MQADFDQGPSAAQCHLLNVQEWESDCSPEIVAVFTGDFEVLVELLFDQWIVLHGDGVPHEVLRIATKLH